MHELWVQILLLATVILGEKAKPAGFKDVDTDVALSLLELNRKNRKAYVGNISLVSMFEAILKAIGRNAIVGKERFSWAPNYWVIDCAKAGTLAHTLEKMKSAGLVYSFLTESYAVHVKYVTAKAKKAFASAVGMEKQAGDSLCSESFYLFGYGITLSVIAAALEPVMAACTQQVKRRDAAVQCSLPDPVTVTHMR